MSEVTIANALKERRSHKFTPTTITTPKKLLSEF